MHLPVFVCVFLASALVSTMGIIQVDRLKSPVIFTYSKDVFASAIDFCYVIDINFEDIIENSKVLKVIKDTIIVSHLDEKFSYQNNRGKNVNPVADFLRQTKQKLNEYIEQLDQFSNLYFSNLKFTNSLDFIGDLKSSASEWLSYYALEHVLDDIKNLLELDKQQILMRERNFKSDIQKTIKNITKHFQTMDIDLINIITLMESRNLEDELKDFLIKFSTTDLYLRDAIREMQFFIYALEQTQRGMLSQQIVGPTQLAKLLNELNYFSFNSNIKSISSDSLGFNKAFKFYNLVHTLTFRKGTSLIFALLLPKIDNLYKLQQYDITSLPFLIPGTQKYGLISTGSNIFKDLKINFKYFIAKNMQDIKCTSSIPVLCKFKNNFVSSLKRSCETNLLQKIYNMQNDCDILLVDKPSHFFRHAGNDIAFSVYQPVQINLDCEINEGKTYRYGFDTLTGFGVIREAAFCNLHFYDKNDHFSGVLPGDFFSKRLFNYSQKFNSEINNLQEDNIKVPPMLDYKDTVISLSNINLPQIQSIIEENILPNSNGLNIKHVENYVMSIQMVKDILENKLMIVLAISILSSFFMIISFALLTLFILWKRKLYCFQSVNTNSRNPFNFSETSKYESSGQNLNNKNSTNREENTSV